MCVCVWVCACHRHQNIIDVRTQPKQFAHKIDQTNVCRSNNNNSICCHALTPTHTPRVKKPKKPSTKISLVMKDIKSKSQQLRHEIEASRWKQSPEQLLVGQKWWATMDAFPPPLPPPPLPASLPLSLSVTPLTFLLRSASRSLNLSIHLVRSACSFRCWPKTFATDSTWKAGKFRRCLSLLSSLLLGAAFLGQVACKREHREKAEKSNSNSNENWNWK